MSRPKATNLIDATLHRSAMALGLVRLVMLELLLILTLCIAMSAPECGERIAWGEATTG